MKKIIIIVIVAAIIAAISYFAFFKKYTLLKAEIVRDEEGNVDKYRIDKETIERKNKSRSKI